MRWTSYLLAAGLGFGLPLFVACNSSPSGPPDILPTQVEDGGHDHAHHHAHGHPDEGPNGGHLIELGNEEYHGEWLHDDESGRLTLFILDGSAKEMFPISARTVTIEKKIGDKTETYELAAAGAEEGAKSAKFEIVDKPLIEALKTAGKGVDAVLVVDIEGKNFRGAIEHHEHGHHHHHH